MPLWLILIIIAAIALAIGSFLNVIIFRLPQGKSIRGRSFCPKCKKRLKALDLLPIISFIVRKGKCRYCGKKISWQYPLVELSTLICFGFILSKYCPVCQMQNDFEWGALIRDFVFTAILIAIFVIDLQHFKILDSIIIFGLIAAIVLNIILLGDKLGLSLAAWKMFLGFAIGAGFFGLQYLFSKGKAIGSGDIKLGALIGLMLAWPQVIFAIALAYILGTLFYLPLLLLRKVKPKQEAPLGSFLALATFIILVWGEKIVELVL